MKKVLISILCVVLLALTSCCVVANTEVVSKEQLVTTAAIPVTTVSKADKTAAILAQLTKEDGTGEIHLKMSIDEITAVLDKYGIEYKMTGENNVFISDTQTSYTANVYEEYGNFDFYQSYSGLKIGDTSEDVLRIYGEPDRIMDNGRKVYIYHTALSDDPWQTPIDFDVEIIDDVVTHIYIYISYPYDKM